MADIRDNLVCLTGATGFIGRRLLDSLVRSGCLVKALYRPATLASPPALQGVEWVAGSLNDSDALRRLTAGCRLVVHCAGSVRGSSREHFFRVNVQGTIAVARAALSEPSCRGFILISSLAARHPDLSPYAGSKRAAEEALAQLTGRLRWAVLRPPAVYGPGDREIRPLFKAMERGFMPVLAGGRNRFSLIHVDDLSAAVAAAAEACISRGLSGRIYELHDGRTGGYTWQDVAEIFAQVRGRRVRLIPVPAPVIHAAGIINLAAARLIARHPMLTPWKVKELLHPDWTCDNTGITSDTGWQPRIGLKFALENGLIGK